MQDWREAGLEGGRKGGIHERNDAERRSAGKVRSLRCRTGRMQDRRDSGHVWYISGVMQERSFEGKKGSRKLGTK